MGFGLLVSGLRLGLEGLCGLFRLRFRHLLLLRIKEGVALDDGLVLGFFLLLDVAAALLVVLLYYLGDLDIHLVGGLLQLEVLAELLADGGKKLVGNLRVGVGLDLDTLPVEEVHEDVQSYVELPDYFT